MKKFLRECAVIMLGAVVLLIQYHMGKYAALNDMNPVLFVLLGTLTLIIAEFKSRLSRSNRKDS